MENYPACKELKVRFSLKHGTGYTNNLAFVALLKINKIFERKIVNVFQLISLTVFWMLRVPTTYVLVE